MMLSIYIGVASFSVVIVSCFVDSLPKHFLTGDAGVADTATGEVSYSGKSLLVYEGCLCSVSDTILTTLDLHLECMKIVTTSFLLFVFFSRF